MSKINLYALSNEELTTMLENGHQEVERRERISELVKQVNELLYELSGELNGYEWLTFVHNQFGEKLFDTKDIEESEDFLSGWFAPQVVIEREE